jgi:dihydroorotase
MSFPRIILRGGRIIDPVSGFDKVTDVAIKEEIIEKIGTVPQKPEDRVIDCTNMLVIPGMIDLHVHCYYRATDLGIHPDIVGVHSGAVAVSDGGSAGAANVRSFRDCFHNKCATRVFSFINAGVEGILNVDTALEVSSPQHFDIDWTLSCIEENPDFIKGIKIRGVRPVIGNLGLDALKLTKRIASMANIPIMLHIGGGQPQPEWPSCLDLLSSGDLVTHCHTANLGNLLDENGKVYPEVKDAISRGVLMDLGHGISRCWSWRVAERCLDQGVPVDVISTDVHIESGPGYDLPTTMSKLMHLGMTLSDLIKKVTVEPAKVLKLTDGSGEIKNGGRADITILKLKEGEFSLSDACNVFKKVEHLFEHVMTIRQGEVFEHRPYEAHY